MSLAVLAATLTTVVVFFPVTFLYGVSKFLFSALALAVVISLFASYFVAMTVIPLFCARFLQGVPPRAGEAGTMKSPSGALQRLVQPRLQPLARLYERSVRRALQRPGLTVAVLLGCCSWPAWRFIRCSASRSSRGPMPGSSRSTLRFPPARRIEVTEQYVAKVEDLIRQTVDPGDFKMIVSNIGVVPDFSALYTSQRRTVHGHHSGGTERSVIRSAVSSTWTGFDDEIASRYPDMRTFFTSGSMVDAILNIGHAGADRRTGDQPRSRSRPTTSRRIWPPASASCRASARSTFRRT